MPRKRMTDAQRRKPYRQSGYTVRECDKCRPALQPGWRWVDDYYKNGKYHPGHWYFESRKNRSDSPAELKDYKKASKELNAAEKDYEKAVAKRDTAFKNFRAAQLRALKLHGKSSAAPKRAKTSSAAPKAKSVKPKQTQKRTQTRKRAQTRSDAAVQKFMKNHLVFGRLPGDKAAEPIRKTLEDYFY